MNKKVIIQLAIVFFLSVGCKGVADREVDVIDMTSHNQLDSVSVRLDDISRSVRIIPLKTPDPIIIGRISQLRLSGKKMFVSTPQGIYVFDSDGNYLSQIGVKGRGPQEYIAAGFIFAGEDNIWIIDDSSKSILRYSHDGAFMDRFSFENQPLASEFYMLGDGEFVSFTPDMGQANSDRMLTFFNRDEIRDSILHANPIQNPGPVLSFLYGEVQFAEYKNDVYFKNIFNGTIYIIKENSLVPAYRVSLGAREPDENARELMTNDVMYSPFDKADKVDLLGISDRYVYLTSNNRPYFYDKNSGKINAWYFILPENPHTDPSVMNSFKGKHIDGENNLIGWVDAADEDDNPVIIVAKLK